MHRLFRTIAIATAFALVLVAAPDCFAQPFMASGRNSAFGGIHVTDPYGNSVLTLTIPQGRRNRILLVDATMVANDPGPIAIGIDPEVNGASMFPGAVIETCGAGDFGCTVSGHWWLDLDTAPDVFVGVPLVVTLVPYRFYGSGDADVSGRAWLQRK